VLRSPHGGKWSVRIDNAEDDRDARFSESRPPLYLGGFHGAPPVGSDFSSVGR